MLQIKNLTKTYKSADKKALDNISFSLKKGEFVALLGPNGAGKSTLINVLGSNVIKDSGSISIGGFDIESHELDTKLIIGIVPQEISIDPFFTINEVLLNQSGYFGIANNQQYIDEILEKLGLTEKQHARTRTLSGGMKRRLLIAKALVHKPQLLILDEPTAGVDLELRQQLYRFLRELHKKGLTIILTTHYLEEVEALCDRIILINHGKIIVDEAKNTLMKKLGNYSTLEFTLSSEISEPEISGLSDFKDRFKNIFEIHIENNILTVKTDKNTIGKVFEALAFHKISYQSFLMQEENLEDVFLKLTKK